MLSKVVHCVWMCLAYGILIDMIVLLGWIIYELFKKENENED